VEQSPIDFPKVLQLWQGEALSTSTGRQLRPETRTPRPPPRQAGDSGNSSSAPRTAFTYANLTSDGETLVVMNTGHNIQVQFDGATEQPSFGAILVPNRGLPESTVQDVLKYPGAEMTSMAKGYPVQVIGLTCGMQASSCTVGLGVSARGLLRQPAS
jgi:hypothetical protein